MMEEKTPTDSRLERLPPEILLEVGRCMLLKELKNMASTSKTMRQHFSKWLFHSVAITGNRYKVVSQMETLLPLIHTEMGQMMVSNVKHIKLHVFKEYYMDGQQVTKLPVLLVTMLQELKNVFSIDLQISDSLSVKEHEKLDDLFSRLSIYTRLYSLEFRKMKEMNWLVDKFARNSIKSLTLDENLCRDLLETAKVACPDLRRLLLRRRNWNLPGNPLPAEGLEAVGKEVAKAFPELEWFVMDCSGVLVTDIYATADLKKLLGPFAHAISGMTELQKLSVTLPRRLLCNIASNPKARGEYLHRDFVTGIEHVGQIAPKLKQICFAEDEWRQQVIRLRNIRHRDDRWERTPFLYRGVRNTESEEMIIERIPAPSRHKFPEGLMY